MSRSGYLILVIVAILLALFVFWPGAGGTRNTGIYDGPIHRTFTLTGFGYRQEVGPETVRILAGEHELSRPVAPAAVTDLWRYWQRIRVPVHGVRSGILPEQLAAYGIDDDSPRLQADGVDLRWGGTDDAGFIYDVLADRIHRCSPSWRARLDAAADRLDQPGLFAGLGSFRVIELADQRYRYTDGSWIDADRPNRPAVGPRIGDLMKLFGDWQLSAPRGVPADGEQLLRMQLQPTEAEQALALVVGRDPDRGAWVRLGELPPQPLSDHALSRLQAVRESLSEELLFAFRDTLMGNPIEGIRAYRGAVSWFSLERQHEYDEWQGESTWDLIWDGGRLRAPSGTAYQMAEALNAITLTDWQWSPMERLWQPPLSPTAVSLILDLGGPERWLIIDGRQLRTARYDAEAAELPELLDPLRLADFIDPQIHNIDQTRLVKLQRIDADGNGRVFVLDADRGWRRTWPEPGPVAKAAMDQLLGAITVLRAEDVRLQTDADRDILADPVLQIDARIAPREMLTGQDDVRVEHTIERDWGLALAPEGEAWRAVDKEAAISYRFTEEQVRELFLPLDRPVLLPVVPTRVLQVHVDREDGTSYRLSRGDGHWRLHQDGDESAVDEVQMRRYLRTLADALYQRQVDGASLIPPSARIGSLRVVMPGPLEERVSWHLDLGTGVGDLHRANVLRSTGADAATLTGSYQVMPELIDVLLPAPSTFQPARAEASGE